MEPLLSINDAAKAANLPEKRIRRWMRDGRLRYLPGESKQRPLRGARIAPADLQECVRTQSTTPVFQSHPKPVTRSKPVRTREYF